MDKIIYQQFQQFIKDGNKDAARKLISAYVKHHPDDADAWYLAATVAGRDQRITLLNKALAIDPFHEKSRKVLARIEESKDSHPQSDPTKNNLHYGIMALLVIAFIVLLILTQPDSSKPPPQIVDLSGALTNPSISLTITEPTVIPTNTAIPYSEEDGFAYKKRGTSNIYVLGLIRNAEDNTSPDDEVVFVGVTVHCLNEYRISCTYLRNYFSLVNHLTGDVYKPTYLSPEQSPLPPEMEHNTVTSGFVKFIIPQSISTNDLLLRYETQYFEVKEITQQR